MTEPRRRIYLDFNATAPLRPAVREAVMAQMDRGGNPSSVHAEGRAARAAIEEARGAVAHLAGVAAERVTFTSGATEAAALALVPGLARDGVAPGRVLIGGGEHAAVRRGHRFPAADVATIPLDRHGLVRLDTMRAMLAGGGPAVVALQAANGETGVVQPITEAAALVHEAGGLLVCDAAQAAGRLDCRVTTLGADVLFLSAHKLGGPQGVGALAVANDGVRLAPSLQPGGGQERGVRGGTENTPGIVGFGAAARDVAELAEAAGWQVLRDRLETGLRSSVPDLVIFGEGASRLPNTSAFAVPGLPNESLLMALDLAGFAVSTGSACASGKVSRSEVLEAMGVDTHLRSGMLRVSFGWSSTAADVDAFLDAFGRLMQRMRRRPARAAA